MRWHELIPYFFIFPALIIIFSVIIYPLLYSFSISLQEYNLLRPEKISFIGLNNYVKLFRDNLFVYSILITIYFVIVSVFIQLLLGLGIALLLNEPLRGRSLVKALLILPWALPGTIIGGMWLWIYHPDYGLINNLLRSINLLKDIEVISWLGSPLLAIHAIIITDVWRLSPFAAVLLLAGLATIPKEIIESSKLDGASSWQRFLYITLPLLKPIIILFLLIRTMFAFQIFDIVYVLTRGGPGTSTFVLMYYAWDKGFNQLNMGYAAAASYVTAIFIIIFATIYMLILRVPLRKGGK